MRKIDLCRHVELTQETGLRETASVSATDAAGDRCFAAMVNADEAGSARRIATNRLFVQTWLKWQLFATARATRLTLPAFGYRLSIGQKQGGFTQNIARIHSPMITNSLWL